MAGSKFYSVMVVGENPEKLMEKYDCALKVKPYVKFRYLDAAKLQKNAIKAFKELTDNHEKLGLNKFQSDYFKERLKAISSMTPFEYYSMITQGLYYDENGDALSEENPNSKWNKYTLGKNFSYPLKSKDGKEAYSMRFGDIDWDSIHMNAESVRLFEAVWDLAVNDRKPETEQEKQIKDEWVGRKAYFDKFKDVDQFVAHNCAYWNYAFLDKDGWHDVDDANNDMEWVTSFYDKFLSNLKDDDLITIYEYSRLDAES